MASLFHSVHTRTGLLPIQLATSDDDLRHRLRNSDWLKGQPFKLPQWLSSVQEILGDPCLISKGRLEALRKGAIPQDVNERRYTRNQAVIKQVTAELAREAVSLQQVSALQSGTMIVATPKSPPPSAPLRADATDVVPGFAKWSDQYRSMSAAPETLRDPRCCNSNDAVQATSQALVRKPTSDLEEAERLRKTVLAPFYDRMRRDSDEIVRLREERANMTAEIEKHKQELVRLQKEPLDDDAGFEAASPEHRALKRKASLTSPMRLGDATNGSNEHTPHGHLIHLANKICKDLGETVPNETIHLCGLAPLKIMEDRPDEVLALAHEKLHTWPYRIVPTCWRRLYEDASLSKAAELLREQADASRGGGAKRRRIEVKDEGQHAAPSDWFAEIVKTLDMGISLSGAPGRSSTFEAVFQQLENHLEEKGKSGIPKNFSIRPPRPLETEHPIVRQPRALRFQEFQTHLDALTTPLIIPGALSHWPASQQWQDPSYFFQMTLGGRRLVPVEVGKSYTDEHWSQTIITFRTFMEDYLLSKEPKDVGYLAQHDLFTQIPALRADITIPDYCYTTPPDTDEAASRTAGLSTAPQLDEPLLNAWFGPKGTKTPLHTDPYHNILCQVVGYKYVRLYAPSETTNLYPCGVDDKGISMENTSQVDVSHVRNRSLGASTDLDAQRELKKKFSKFADAKFVEGVLAPGECLYVPLGWWHYVESLTTSFSVSFWWN
ncbi:hypothetical protein LTR37_007858 [Vermiconidia calcicola]|uniref:Uncharacterized protein n=1 Tax=Vermiconidia calcicola TaxID=1690605 RepID=A0ACC3NCF5_9PEZI|nr:hypothetical protein LTR37_007858 [Vermiconidia calcicola]